MSEGDLKRAIELVKAGNKKDAGEMLAGKLKQNPKNETAWLWLSACYDDLEKIKCCLEKVIEINPEHQKVRIMLDDVMKVTHGLTEDSKFSSLELENISSIEDKPDPPQPKS